MVLLSLPFKSCGWDLTDVPPARVTAKSSRRPPRGSSAGKAFELFDALASGVVKHRHVAVFEGEVAAVVLLDISTVLAHGLWVPLACNLGPGQ